MTISQEILAGMPIPGSFDDRIGLRYETLDEELCTASVEIGPHLLSHTGSVPGGVFATLAEGLASIGTAVGVVPRGFTAMGQANETTVLSDVSSGALHVTARRRSAGEREWVWVVEVSDDGGRPCALTVMTVAVRPQRAS